VNNREIFIDLVRTALSCMAPHHCNWRAAIDTMMTAHLLTPAYFDSLSATDLAGEAIIFVNHFYFKQKSSNWIPNDRLREEPGDAGGAPEGTAAVAPSQACPE
jgi:hypothetical protein